MSDATIVALHRLGWVLLGLGIFSEALNVVYSLSWFRRGRRQTHILILPALFNMIGLALLYGNRAIGLMAATVAAHLFLVVVIPYIGRRYCHTNSESPGGSERSENKD